ncbi:TPA: DHCW motif cupin fold protein [Enterobacter hormaechei]
MKLPDQRFSVVDWRILETTEHPGDAGMALARTVNLDDIRIRVVEYSPGYIADHWCDRGHILYLIEGDLQTELKDGRSFDLEPGMGFLVSDFADPPHRALTKNGAKVFIVD